MGFVKPLKLQEMEKEKKKKKKRGFNGGGGKIGGNRNWI